jgi:hypothetical protein
MLVRHARGLVGVHQQPAVLQAAVVRRAGIGPVLPRIGRVIAVLPQIIVVSRPRPPGRMQAVVALIGLEPAFRHVYADDRVRGNAEVLQALEVRRHMSLADQHVADADLLQVIAERGFPDPQRPAVPVRTVRAHVAAGIERHPRRPADRRLHIGVGKQHAALCHRVDVRRLQDRVAGAAEIVVAKLVAHDPEHVLRRRFGRHFRHFGWSSERAGEGAMVRYCRANDNRAGRRARGGGLPIPRSPGVGLPIPGVNVWIARFSAIERRSMVAR